MPQKNSPPPTPVSSPRVSPTPPGSPTSSTPSDSFDNDPTSAGPQQQQQQLGLSPSNIPLRPVHAPPDNAPSLNIITVDPAPSQLTIMDDMDIDDAPASPSGSPMRGAGVNGTHPNNTSDDGSANGSDPDWSTDDWMVDMRRVKVYELVGATWTDRGTALCTGVYDEELDTAAIVAKSELNDVELLRSEIRASDVYQKQQDTLIVWTEPDGTDYALSFQDMEGCSEIWDFVVEVQRHFRGKSQTDPNSSFSSGSGGDSSQSRLTVASIVASGRLPEPALGIIADLDSAIKAIAKTIHGRERICEYILNEDYIKALIDVMEQAEDLESLPDLHALHGIIQTILSMNDHGIYDYVLHEDIFLGVVGILEYDPEFPTYKASYRDFLKNAAITQRTFHFQFHSSSQSNDSNDSDVLIQRKISQTYRLQFLKDVVLARVIDDSTFNVLNSFILFNQIEIINFFIAGGGAIGGIGSVSSVGGVGMEGISFLEELFKGFVTDEEILKAGSSSSGPGNLFGTVGSNTNGVNGNGKSRENAPSPPPSPSLTSPSAVKDQASNLHPIPLQTKANGVISPSTKADVIRFVHQLCMTAKGVQIPTRIGLYRVLVERGMLFALEWALRVPLTPNPDSANPNPNNPSDPDPPLLDMVAEILILAAEFNTAGMRAHIVRQNEAAKAREEEEVRARAGEPIPASGKPVSSPHGNRSIKKGESPHFLKALTARLGGTKDQPFRNQVGDAIRLLLESPPSLDFHTAGDAKGNTLIKMREDPINEHFFPVFYDPTLITAFYKPLLDLEDWKHMPNTVLKLSREQSALFLYLCDLLCTILVQHSHRSQYFILSCGISAKIASLLRTRDKHMRLAALRYFRTCIRINNHFVIRHLIKHDCFSPILTLAAEEAERDNLVSASCQEFFENIRKDNLRLPMTHIMEKYEDKVRALAEMPLVSPRFRAFILRWEQNSQPPPPTAVKPSEAGDVDITPDTRKWGQGTNLEAEEESYFNGSDDEDDVQALVGGVGSSTGSPSAQNSMWGAVQQQSPTRSTSTRRSLRGASRGHAMASSSPQRATRSSTAAAAAAASSSPSSPQARGSRPETPTPSSPGRVGSPITVPQAYPMRSLLVYDEDDADEDGDEIIGPMPAIQEEDEESASISKPAAGSPSTSTSAPTPASSISMDASTPVIVKSSGGHRALQRAESSPNLAELNQRAAAAATNGSSTASAESSSSSSSSGNAPSNQRRARGGSIISGSEAASSSPSSAPPLKRRRDDEDDDDEIFSLMTRSTRRKSLESRSPARTPSPSSDAKGKGREAASASSTDTSSADEGNKPGVGDKQGAAKRMRLSLKAALGLSKDNKDGTGPTSRSPSPSLSATATVKDGDGG